MIKCSSCGGRFTESAKECPYCGTPVAEMQKEQEKTQSQISVGNFGYSVEDLVERVKYATVCIKDYVKTKDGIGVATGTGFFVNYKGQVYLISNAHVVSYSAQNKGHAVVVFPSIVDSTKNEFDAMVEWYDQLNDVAVLHLCTDIPEEVRPMELADMKSVRQGQVVISVGCPRGIAFDHIIGDVSNVGTEEKLSEMGMNKIYCNLNATHGNSGGSVVRVNDGKVIGITSAIFEKDYLPGKTICVTADAIKQLINKYSR